MTNWRILFNKFDFKKITVTCVCGALEFYNLYITPKEYSFRFIFYRKSLPHLNGVYINGTSNSIRAP